MTKTLKIASFSSPFLVTVEKEVDLIDVIKIMQESDIRHIPVVENEHPVGVISDRDLKVFENRDFAEKFTAADIMVPNPFTVNEDTDLREVVKIMSDNKFGSCLIQDENSKITGIFTIVDALRTLKILLERAESENVATIKIS